MMEQDADKLKQWVDGMSIEQLKALYRWVFLAYMNRLREGVIDNDAVSQTVGGLAMASLLQTTESGGTVEIPSLGIKISVDKSSGDLAHD